MLVWYYQPHWQEAGIVFYVKYQPHKPATGIVCFMLDTWVACGRPRNIKKQATDMVVINRRHQLRPSRGNSSTIPVTTVSINTIWVDEISNIINTNIRTYTRGAYIHLLCFLVNMYLWYVILHLFRVLNVFTFLLTRRDLDAAQSYFYLLLVIQIRYQPTKGSIVWTHENAKKAITNTC